MGEDSGQPDLHGLWLDISLPEFLDAAPDGILIVDTHGRIRSANEHASALFGWDVSSLVGHLVEELLPEPLREHHVAHRADYLASPRSRAMGIALDLVARRSDGSEFPVDVSLNTLGRVGESVIIAFVRDASERKEAERHAAEARQAEQHRLQALEINDRFVQGITAALLTLESGDARTTAQFLRQTMAKARARIEELLGELDQCPVEAGDLVREVPAQVLDLTELERLYQPPARHGRDPVRVLIADDSPDLRLLLRIQLGSDPDVTVVGEAGDGAEAIEQAEALRPDVVLLDLAMPVMDGLQALPELRRRVPEAAVVVVSGFGSGGRLGPQSLALGAAAYLEKGAPTEELLAVVRAVGRRERTHALRSTPPS